MSEWVYLVLGWLLGQVSSVITSRLRESEATRAEDREQIRRLKHAIFVLLRVRDEFQSIRYSLAVVAERFATQKEDQEAIRQELMTQRKRLVEELKEQLDAAVDVVAETDPFIAHQVASALEQRRSIGVKDFSFAVGDEEAYELLTDWERARLINLKEYIDAALRLLAAQAEIDVGKLDLLLSAKDESVAEGVEEARKQENG